VPELLKLEYLNGHTGPDVRAAINLPLPPDAGLDLLEALRRVVLDCLDEITSWKAIIHGPRAGEVHEEIRCLSQRLSEITKALQKVSQKMEDDIMREIPGEEERRLEGTEESGPSEEEIPF
jgi:hypothetical protein